MDVKAIRTKAKEQYQGFCRVCHRCDGRVCAGQVPGMGGAGTGSAFSVNVEKLAEFKFNLRTIHNVTEPDLTTEFMGKTLAMPIMAAPITGIVYNCGGALSEQEFVNALVEGSIKAGTLGKTGDGAVSEMFDAGLNAIADFGGIPYIKPRVQAEIIARIKRAEEAGALAIGVDIDGAGLVTMALKGQPVGPKSEADLRELINSTALPFILKGIMTPDEAEMAVEVGAKAIVVSNHGGRVLDYTPATCEVLPAIKKAVKGKIKILVDGGVRSGADVLKMLALGADAVLVGRPLITAAFGGGATGVETYLKQMAAELSQAMILTGTASVKTVNPLILHTK